MASSYYTTFFVALSLMCASSCSPGLNEADLHGSWQGVAVLEEGDSLPVDPSVIKFRFDDNKYYQFESTLNYKEAGTYYLDDVYLYTTDTFNKASSEKIVEVLLLNEDSLHMLMKEQTKERVLKLVKSD
jgi:hypothetical protein